MAGFNILQHLWSPVVMVIASPEADDLCIKANGMSFAEILRPFGILRNMNDGMGVPVRTVADHPFRLHDWNLRFYASSTMHQPSSQGAEERLRLAVSEAVAAAPIGVWDEAGGGNGGWWEAFRNEHLRMLSFGDHETFDHPVACILVLPSTFEGDPVSAFAEMFDNGAPALLKQGVMEPRILKHYVMLHDAHAAPADAAERAGEALRVASAALGSTCHVISINEPSGEGATAVDPAPWAATLKAPVAGGGAGEPLQRPPVPAGGLACAVSEANAAALSTFVLELAVRSVIPHMEARIRALNHQVTVARRGLRNQLKSFLWRGTSSSGGGGAQQSPGSSGTGTAGQPAVLGSPKRYAHTTVESEMRQLSDLALMLGDADTALSTLRLLSSDLKSEKAHRHYAAAQEAMGAAAALAGAADDAAAHLKEAFYRYNMHQQLIHVSGSKEGIRYATRAAMLMSELLAASGRPVDASWACMKAHLQEDNLAAGLLLERAALGLLAASPPQARRAAFYTVLSGLRLGQARQPALARRAYRQVWGEYRGRRWGLIEEHVAESLGKQAREAGDAAGALMHLSAALLCPSSPAAVQRRHLLQFIEALAEATREAGRAPVLELPLPEVDVTHVTFFHAGRAGHANLDARQTPDGTWRVLETALQPLGEASSSTNWLDGVGARASQSDAAASTLSMSCCVGEVVSADVTISNPLDIDLAVSRLRLVCSMEAAAPAGPADGENDRSGGAPTATSGPAAEVPSFQALEERLTLRAGERMVVNLRVRPLRPGTLHVESVAWMLEGAAHGERRLAIPRPRPRRPGTDRIILDAERPPPGGATFVVLPPMPRLEASVESLPSSAFAGEMVECALRLKNAGTMTLQGLRAATDSKEIFLGTPEPPTATAAAAAAASPKWAQQATAVTSRQGIITFSLPAGGRLGVGQQLTVPVWIRPSHPGPLRCNVALYYEPLVKTDSLRHRTLRLSCSTMAMPSLAVDAAAAVAPAAVPGRCLLRLEALNLQGLESFRLESLRCVSECWALRAMDGDGMNPAVGADRPLGLTVGPEAAATVHLFAEPAKDSSTGGERGITTPIEQAVRHLMQHEGATASREAAPTNRGTTTPAAAAAAASNALQGPLSLPLDLALHWEAQGTSTARSGFTLTRAPVAQGPPIHMQLVAPPAAVHRFADNPLCTVTLRLRLRNMVPAAAAVCVQTGWANDDTSVTLGLPSSVVAAATEQQRAGPTVEFSPSLRRCTWVGRTRATLLHLAYNQTADVHLQVAVTGPGRTEVGPYEVSWSYAEAPQLSGTCRGPACSVMVEEEKRETGE